MSNDQPQLVSNAPIKTPPIIILSKTNTKYVVNRHLSILINILKG